MGWASLSARGRIARLIKNAPNTSRIISVIKPKYVVMSHHANPTASSSNQVCQPGRHDDGEPEVMHVAFL